jgi:tetratricopeptide (TPR) repeat protein
MTEDVYTRLFAQLNEGCYDAPEVLDAIATLGPHALVLRGLARARRHAWASTRADMLAACSGPDVEPLTEYIAGVALFVARDYDASMACLRSAAGSSVPAVATYSSKLAAKFARELGWVEESLVLLDAIAASMPAADREGRTQELRRKSAVRQRASDALLGSTHEAASKAWRRVYIDGAAAAASSIDTLLERRGDHPELLAVRVRLDLLCGDRARARGRLASASPELLLAEGAYDEVLALLENSDDPRALHLRGEALLSIDAFAEAAATLERARGAMPYSIAIALSLAIARHFEDPNTPAVGFEHRFAALLEAAPGLLADAAGVLGRPLWTDEGPISGRADIARILVQARALLTDDRDSVHSHYRRPGQALRQVLPAQLDRPSHRARLHEDDLRWIDKIQSTLVAKVGIDPRGPAGPASRRAGSKARWQPQSLSPAQLEQFLADGFLVIPRAFDPELAQRWRDDANRRIREAPEKWVRGYDPADEHKSLRSYSPTDPSTWTWPRLVLEGSLEVPVDEFAPRAWAAICDLLGGPDRIKTRSWSNYFNLNFCEFAELGFDRPEPDWVGWHIDDPHPAMRLDGIQNGLVCITLFDAVLPASGNTWLCPDSVARVARELASHPEGVDFVSDRGARITRQCQRFHEVVGETGDVFLLHPLLMHSASPNRSGRIRWMGNPMVYMEQPLDPRRPLDELSPVELAIRRAIS